MRLVEIPDDYRTDPGAIRSLFVAVLGIVLTVFFFQSI
jgi:hypothetical protein